MLEKLLSDNKDWDFCILYIEGRAPVLVEKDVDLKMMPIDPLLPITLVMNSISMHPAPRDQQMAQKEFKMVSFFETAKIYAIDFYTESRIQMAPGPVISMVDR